MRRVSLSQPLPRHIAFYDGECPICQGLAGYLLKRDRHARFDLAPLHGETYNRLIPPEIASQLPDSMLVLTRRGRLYQESDAALFVARHLGRADRLLSTLAWPVPRMIRDRVYTLIANNRHRILSPEAVSCEVPSDEARRRLLP